ncbi:MAG: polysaccharide lyase family 7 protein [Colwellia sp.]|nr:polysaccharide lyase family 7 protein [Colwellia sp.]
MLFNRSIFITCSLLLLLGCGSESENDSLPETIIITGEVIEEVTEEITEEVIEDISCDGLAKLNFVDATASDELTSYSASNTIDSNFISESRWSTSHDDQTLILTLNAAALIKGFSITWLNNDGRSYSYDVEVSKDKNTWLPVISSQLSNSTSTRAEYIDISESTAIYLKVIPQSNTIDSSNHIVEVEAFGCMIDVASNIELDDWYLSIPVDESLYSKAESIKESALNNDYFNHQFSFLDSDGGMVFRAPIEGAKTSTNTSYTRTELREMLRRGNTSISTKGINTNNWVFSSASTEEQEAAGGVDGELIAELTVNHVTDTGDRSQVGRVIIGQIHANDDEPIRVYYRKLPENDKGAIYLAHEILGGDDIYYELIGTRSKSADNPASGIALNERFGYKITVVGNQLTFTIVREGQEDITETVDMSNSGYDLGGQYMYFKAGVYNPNNTGDPKDYVQATFYKIDNSHTGYMAN